MSRFSDSKDQNVRWKNKLRMKKKHYIQTHEIFSFYIIFLPSFVAFWICDTILALNKIFPQDIKFTKKRSRR